MVSFPNAKINLGLNIIEKRKDGFHNIESCFYPVNWPDILEIIPSDDLKLSVSGIPIPGNPSENLIFKLYLVLKKDFSLPPVHIHLHKNIPIGAGLGGGSSDAAFTIKSLNKLFDLNLSLEQMENYVRPLGSDCAFFISNKPVLATGKGDTFQPVPGLLKGKHILLVNPAIHISTREAYEGIAPKAGITQLKDILFSDINNWKESLVNDFEEFLFIKYPALEVIKSRLYSLGAQYASMTGSGSTIFGIFDQLPETNLNFPENYKIFIAEL